MRTGGTPISGNPQISIGACGHAAALSDLRADGKARKIAGSGEKSRETMGSIGGNEDLTGDSPAISGCFLG